MKMGILLVKPQLRGSIMIQKIFGWVELVSRSFVDRPVAYETFYCPSDATRISTLLASGVHAQRGTFPKKKMSVDLTDPNVTRAYDDIIRNKGTDWYKHVFRSYALLAFT